MKFPPDFLEFAEIPFVTDRIPLRFERRDDSSRFVQREALRKQDMR
jgi:hypothetical protein